MKRCPECRRDYFDDSLLYCLDDGTALLEGPGSGSEAMTARFNSDSNPFPTETTKFLGRDSSAETARPASGNRAKIGIAAGVILLVLIGSAWAIWKYLGDATPTGPSIQNMTLTRVTTSGRAQGADISPDGKFIVYLEMEDDGDRGLWIKQVATGDTIPIVPATRGNVLRGVSFSRDGNFVYYLFTDRTRRLSLFQVSSLGGTPKKIADVADSPVTFSPDGERMAFLRYADHTKSSIVTTKIDGSDERVLASLDFTEWFLNAGASWSPDGNTIAIAAGVTTDSGDVFRLVGIDANDGSIRELSDKRWMSGGRVVWMPDGQSLLIAASDRLGIPGAQLWQIAYPAGTAVQITNDSIGRDDTSLGVTADGKTILSATMQFLSRIESMPTDGKPSSAAKLSTSESNLDGFMGLAVAPDGRLVFSSYEGGQVDLWVMNADGTGRRKLTTDSHMDIMPTVSPDGKYVLFKSNRPNGDAIARLFRMDIDGTNIVQLAERSDSAASVSPDGQTVIHSFWSTAEKMQSLWKLSIDGGQQTRLTDYPVFDSSFSPDGKLIGLYFSDTTGNRWKFGVIPAEGGKPIRHFEFPSFQYEWVRWTQDGKNVSFIGAPPDPSNIWLQPVEGGEAKKLTDFKSDYIYRHEWSRDGKTLFLVRGRPSFDIVLQTVAK